MAHGSTMYSLFLAGLFCVGIHSLQNKAAAAAAAVAEESSVRWVCAGGSVTFPWTSSSAQGVGSGGPPQTMQWIREDEGGDPSSPTTNTTLLASYSASGTFTPSPSYAPRVRLTKDGQAMVLEGLTPRDTASYKLMVTAGPDPQQGDVAPSSPPVRQLNLTVGVDGLVSKDGDLHVVMGRRAFWEDQSSQWVIRLSCGNFSFLRQPPFDVLWTTPAGEETPHNSSGYSQGQFYLHLLPPVAGGRYACRVPQDSFPEACVPPGGGSQGDGKLESSLWVDEHLARVLVLEADLEVMTQENSDLKANQTHLREEMSLERETREEEMREMREEMREMREERGKERETREEEMREMREEMGQLRQEVTQQQEAANKMRSVSGALTQLTAKISHLSTNVAFMTQLSRDLILGSHTRIKLDRVFYNAGNGYQATNGKFTAPVAGTYLFFVKTESRPDKAVTLAMKAGGRRVMYLHAKDEKAYLTPSGTVVVHLNAGGQAWMDTDWVGRNYVRVWTTFGGLLVRPDVTD